MFISALRIENVRSIRDLDLSFLQPENQIRRWTLIIGENGSGKSTLLRALALVTAGSESLASLLVDPDSWITNGARFARIEADVLTAEGEPRTFKLNLRRGQGVSQVIKANDANLEPLDDALRHTARNYLTVGYGVSRRLSGGHPRSVAKEDGSRSLRSRSVGTLFSPDAELQSVETWAMDLHYRRGSGGIGVVRRALAGILPGVTFHSIDRERRRLVFATVDGLVPMMQLSDGYQNVAAWAGDLLYRVTETFRNYRNPLSARGLLLIDEIDLHLHPVWQRRLRTFLDDKLSSFQIIATTHSALTAQQAAAGELFYFKRRHRKVGVTLSAFEGDPQKLMSHQLLLNDAFGLTTLNSPQVQGQRDRYRKLRTKRRPSATEQREMKALKGELRDIPDWSRPTKQDKETLAALRSIERELLKRSPRVRTSAGAKGAKDKRR
jgi:hypothetical protein